eukprot:TRINITY_DN4640_c0_g1_i1.p1 TRINITY_DN4640_c0_g1~~TRINITY_DN4640_c0_g1_i1.p1  ORF type:complete len:349 (+),score=104.18 TRINITY_DN4640_c0_g1_i1:509-1555(+)
MMKRAVQGAAAATVGIALFQKTAYAEGSKVLSRFGLVADIQTADIEPAYNFNKTARRSYRGSLEALGKAVDAWRDEKVDFVIDLGDIIDQVNETRGESRSMLEKVLGEFARLPEGVPVYHLVGNHELYNFTREEMLSLIPGIAVGGRTYHDFAPAKGWRVVVLDSYDLHCINDRETSPFTEKAFRLLEENNPNDVRAARGTTNWSHGLSGLEARWMPYNGGVSDEQLAWLDSVVARSVRSNEKLIVFTHVPLLPGSAADTTLVWNYTQVLAILDKAHTAAVFAGHAHKGGYARSPSGTHHITIPSPLNTTDECPTAHAVVELYEDSIKVTGSTCVPSYKLEFNKYSKL